MTFLTQIVNRRRTGPEPVPTPEWPELDGQVHVRTLDAVGRIEFFDAAYEQKATQGAAFYALVAAYCAVTAEGVRMFQDGDWSALVGDAGSGSAIDRIYRAADALNFLSAQSREILKKKYEPAPHSNDNSTSPAAPESR